MVFICLKEVLSFVAKAINTRFEKMNNIHNLKFAEKIQLLVI